MTHGQLITRLCKMRDDLTETVVQLKDAPVEWVKEEPEGCIFCDGSEPPEEAENIYGTAVASSWCGKYLLIPSAESDGYRRCFISYCPMCGRDLRGT